ncbi:hypothetical protein DFO67_11565 [Modicisalibacter xianhensis]|uniref:Uncharacterized protein n=1 Tax=Modicisalibacter xianhensis TaxID=442341 RepID=A0A4R8FKL6_9GAMM|nr:hypothetical protein [Halomonas xianhensis]TDX26800.1 hypothetical protein DFO67_11565 [Halomonas xianhensis]
MPHEAMTARESFTDNSSNATAPETAEDKTTHKGGPGINAWHVLLIGFLIAIFAMGYLLNKRLEAVEVAARNANPPMVIIDFAKLVQQYPEGASAEEVNALMQQTNQAIFALQETGMVVLDSSAVMVAPPEMYLSPEMLMGATGQEIPNDSQ